MYGMQRNGVSDNIGGRQVGAKFYLGTAGFSGVGLVSSDRKTKLARGTVNNIVLYGGARVNMADHVNFHDLCVGLFAYQVSRRLTAENALKHAFFQ